MRLTLFLFLFFLQSFAFTCQAAEPKRPIVLVSIAPYKFFVDQIAGDTVTTEVVVPTGGSPHAYEPTVKQILEASKAEIWFTIGETFETRALQALQHAKHSLEAIDLREGLPLIYSDEESHAHCGHAHSADPHIWLSPRLAQRQAQKIAEVLSKHFPFHQPLYVKNLDEFKRRLQELDKKIYLTLSSMKNRTLLVSHPAFAYYAKDYDLKQVSIEFEGKEPSPRHLTRLLEVAKQEKHPYIYIQKQHSSKGARLIAKEIGATIIEVDPLAENYFENILEMTHNFSKQ